MWKEIFFVEMIETDKVNLQLAHNSLTEYLVSWFRAKKQ